MANMSTEFFEDYVEEGDDFQIIGTGGSSPDTPINLRD